MTSVLYRDLKSMRKSKQIEELLVRQIAEEIFVLFFA